MKKIIYIFLCFFLCNCSQKKLLLINKRAIFLSSENGGKSKTDTLFFTNKNDTKIVLDFNATGMHADFFKINLTSPKLIAPKETIKLPIQFTPKKEFIGVAFAQLHIKPTKKNTYYIPLNGLSTKGLEGKNEPSLSTILETLNYKINIGWNSLSNTINPQLQGEELQQTLFVKASKKDVEIIPIARYSPAFLLPFGFYTIKNNNLILNEVGVLADSNLDPEHQTLYPKISKGENSFDPGLEAFGIYTSSPSHQAYSEDKWNKKFHEKKAAHAARIYQLKDAKGKAISNQFLICFEEAFNGDYQDYVFILKNATPIK